MLLTSQLESLPYCHSLTMPTTPAAVRLARQTMESVLAEWGVNPHHPSVGPAILTLGELVTNAVRHAAALSPQLTVVCGAEENCLLLGVHDRHPYRPVLPAVTPPMPPGGLAMVVEVAADSGGVAFVSGDADGAGKSVWVTLPL
ncbi:ATP-binding protein [Streptomyces tendae]|uniref:ATP-binding protein n=1 Tax=Streptomyces tendae TaxID=1932 RepID=UPI0037901B60